MKISKLIYFSPLGFFYSAITNVIGFFQRPFMVYGYWNSPTKSFQRLTRYSSTTFFVDKQKINIANHCWIWHHTIIDGSNGVTIGEGAQIGAWVGIFTHSSHLSIRLLGRSFISADRSDKVGYLTGSVEIGEYSFIGAGSYILPKVKIGKGCIVAAASVVICDVPDFSVVSGNPAKVIGSTLNLDRKYFKNASVQSSYFDPEVIKSYLSTQK